MTEPTTHDELLASAIRQVAANAPDADRFGDCVYIAAVVQAWPRSADSVRTQLVKLHRAGLIELSRADLVAAMDAGKLRDSEVIALDAWGHELATFHLVRVAA